MSSVIELVARECNLSTEWVTNVLRSGYSRVKKIKVPKKNKSGYRLVSRPSAELEILQRWLVLRFLSKYRIHPSAMAFIPRRSILSNATFHKESQYFIRVDFKDFFPSIKLVDLVKALIDDRGCADSITKYDGYREFLERLCFDYNHSLPIGYISSPVISNIVMWEFDEKLAELIKVNHAVLGNARVSRYADDIVFSTNKRGGCQKFLELFKTFVASQRYPTLRINDEKTLFSSKPRGTSMVTGLRICSDSRITITKKYKDGVRLMLSLHAKGGLKREDFPVLKGHLAFIRSVAPAFYSKICLKYVDTISVFL